MEAIRAGAFDLLTKPLIDQELEMAIDRALSQRKVVEENQQLREQLGYAIRHGEHRRPRSPHAADLRHDRQRGGHQGHDPDHRRKWDGQIVDCPGNPSPQRTPRASRLSKWPAERLPESLLESELFGHVAGAFTGASGDKIGKFKQADGGTIFLDEIGTATPSMQVKLLRVLQEFEFEQVGGTKTFHVDTRVDSGHQRESGPGRGRGPVPAGSLLPRQRDQHRIAVAARTDRRHSAAGPAFPASGVARTRTSRSAVSVTKRCQRLQHYNWPGNVRELQNVVERAVLLGKGPIVTVEDLPDQVDRRCCHDLRSHHWPDAQGSPGRSRAADHSGRAAGQQLESQSDRRNAGHQPHDALQKDEASGARIARRHGIRPAGVGIATSERFAHGQLLGNQDWVRTRLGTAARMPPLVRRHCATYNRILTTSASRFSIVALRDACLVHVYSASLVQVLEPRCLSPASCPTATRPLEGAIDEDPRVSSQTDPP